MIKKINLRGISEILSEKELKNVMGGSNSDAGYTCDCTLASGFRGCYVSATTGRICTSCTCS